MDDKKYRNIDIIIKIGMLIIAAYFGWLNYNINNNLKQITLSNKRERDIMWRPDKPTTVTSIDTSYWQGKYDIEKTQFSGLIAQQVDSAAQKVGYDFNGVDKAGPIMGLRYAEFVVPLIKAVQELSKEVDSLKAVKTTTGSNQRTNSNNDEQNESINSHNIELANNAILYQNAPNPFGNGTTIKYFVPENADAQIIFYDEFGTQIKIFKITDKGNGQLNVDASNLAAGMYSYSLIISGKIVDTKKMIKQ